MNMSEVERLELELATARAEAASAKVSRQTEIKPRYITLNEWATSQFSKVPHYNTLIRWVHDGRIQPQPKKIGRAWQVRPNAEYVED